MKKLMLIDGNSLIHRAYHALPAMHTMNKEQSVPTGAVHGFINMLLSLIQKQSPTHIITAFDTRAKTPRHELFPDYKGTRKPTDEELIAQFPIIKNLLFELGIKAFEKDGFEADDLLGILSRRAENEGFETLLVTGDKDSFQLITDHTKVLLTRKGISETELFDKEHLREIYGVEPATMIEIKGLMGDSSDNIPGVPGVGEKTALKLIHEYGTIENVLLNIENISGKKLKERLEENKDLAMLSRALGTIIIDENPPLDIQIEEGFFSFSRLKAGKPALIELELYSVAKRLENDIPVPNAKDVQHDFEIPDLPEIEEIGIESLDSIFTAPKIEEIIISDEEALKNAKNEWNKCSKLAVIYNNGISLCDGDRLYTVYIKQDMLSEGVEEQSTIDALADIMRDENIAKLTFDGKSLMHRLSSFGIETKGIIFDALIAAYLIDSTSNDTPLDLCRRYALRETCDAYGLFLLEDIFIKKMGQMDLYALFTDMEMPLMHVLYDMEKIGFNVDKNVLRQLGKEFEGQIEALKQEIYELSGESFNILSPKQLGVILFEKLNLPAVRKTKTGYSTDAQTLEVLSDKHMIAGKTLEYRHFAKLKSTYIDGLLQAADSNSRVHTSFKQTVTATGRISSTEPNLQNIPVRTKIGREIRRAFVASEGNVLVGADYSQIELRVLAHISDDAVMTESFLKQEDIHTRTASEVFSVQLNDVDSQMRSAAKAVNFGIVYGISDFGLSKQLNIDRATAKNYIQNYLAKYTGITTYMEDVVQKGKDKGFVSTIFGRRRDVPELKSSNFQMRSFGERIAMNAPIQGSAADIIKYAMVRVFESLKSNDLKSKLILQVHDELIIDTIPQEQDIVMKIIKECMENVVDLKVPLIADVKSGKSWYDTK